MPSLLVAIVLLCWPSLVLSLWLWPYSQQCPFTLNMSYTNGLAWVPYSYPQTRSEAELAINIRKATNTDETAPKRKHVRACIVYTWDHKSSQSFWAGMKVYVDDLVG